MGGFDQVAIYEAKLAAQQLARMAEGPENSDASGESENSASESVNGSGSEEDEESDGASKTPAGGVFDSDEEMPDAPASQECLLDEADMESESSCNDEDVDGDPVAEGDEVNPDKELRSCRRRRGGESGPQQLPGCSRCLHGSFHVHLLVHIRYHAQEGVGGV